MYTVIKRDVAGPYVFPQGRILLAPYTFAPNRNPSLDFTLQLPLHQRPPLQKPLQHLKQPPQRLPRRQLQAQQPLLQHLQPLLAEKFMLNHGFLFNFLKN